MPGVTRAKPRQAIGGAVRAIRGRNCVCVRGIGAVCCIADEDDCSALLALVEKNALAWLHAAETGSVPTLSWLDKKLMRFVYTTKYSKKK